MAGQKSTPMSYVLVFQSTEDPGPGEVAAIRNRLGHLQAEEVLPGTFRVVGFPSEVEVATKGLSSWRLAPEGRLRRTPPGRIAAKR